MISQRSRSLSHVLATSTVHSLAHVFFASKSILCLLALVIVFPASLNGQDGKPTEDDKAKVETKAESTAATPEKPVEEKKSDEPKNESEPSKEVKPPEPTLAIINATIYPVGSKPISNGKILIANDSIVAIGGADLSIPEGIEAIDATGLILTPGWIDVGSRLWLNPSSNDEGTGDGSLKAVDGLDPFAEDWKDVIAAGVTTIYVQPSSQSSMGGLGAAVAVMPGDQGKLTIHNGIAGLQMSLGRFVSNRDRSARYDALKNGLQAIADYKKKWDEYEEAVKKATSEATAGNAQPIEGRRETEGANVTERPSGPEGQSMPERRSGGFRREGFGGREGQEGRGGSPGRTRPDGQTPDPRAAAQTPSTPTPNTTTATAAPTKPKKPDVDPVKQRLLGVLSGEIPIRLEVHNANDAHYAFELRKQFPKANWILEDVDQLGIAMSSIRESRLPLVLGSWVNFSQLNSAYVKRIQLSKDLLQVSDSLVCIATQSTTANGSQYLREHLAVACSNGLQKDRALKAVTQDAAKLIGCDKKLGVLAPGYRADIVGFAGDPLDTSVAVRLVVSGGKVLTKPSEPTVSKSTASFKVERIPQALPSKFQLHSTHVLMPDGYADVTLTIAGGKVIAVEQGSKENGTDLLVDLGDNIVTPGLQSVYGTLGLESQLRGVDSNSAHLSPSNLTTIDISTRKWIEQSGLHVIALTTGSTNTFPGQVSLYSLSSEGKVLASSIGSKIVLSADARSMERFPSSLAGQAKFVRDALSLKIEPTRLFVPEQTIEHIATLKKEVMKSLVGQTQVAIFLVTNDAEVEVALQIVEQFKLKASLVGARSFGKYVERLKALKVSVIAQPPLESDYPRYMSDLVSCQNNGVAVYFAGENGSQLRLAGARAVQAGMSESWTLQALTSGIANLYGTELTASGFKTGNTADLIVWSGNPLDLTSQPVLQICGGEIITDKDKP
jgi:imidazolonepropionase-like amidohydrolase